MEPRPPKHSIPVLRGLEIVAGVYCNVHHETKFGHAIALGTAKSTIWSPLGIYVYPSGATAMTISSGSVDDKADGTGARTVIVTGLDDQWNEEHQAVTLNGQAGVAIPIELRRAYRIKVITAGSGGQNVGILYVGEGAIASGIPATIYAQVDVGLNQTLMTPYTIRAGKKGYITCLFASLGANKDLTLEVVVREPGEVFRVRRIRYVRSVPIAVPFELPIGPIPAQSDIEVRGYIDAGTTNVGAAYDVVLIDV